MCIEYALSIVGLLSKIMDVGRLIMYMYMQHSNFEGGGGDFSSWPYVEKTLLVGARFTVEWV